ncbi:putative pyridoxamine 5'-phosphate oxidase [Triangularia setosa]|uniref:Pyridoxamine 5'-phosphate oxidase n=1 Tax=Triangularia setosa TaxID=2587417 RepID=A0AAN7A9H1_9PEZI|nr:putative pyridoxamine 5'-phosphate oxidase [Podospora setosa]
MEQQIPLSHEASAGDTNMRVTNSLPTEVVQCLENARFLHLATCHDNVPHVSLMNYTYLPSSPYSNSLPEIVMTTNPASKKMNNLATNPNVSLLVHDWVSHRPTTTTQSRRLSNGHSSPSREPPSSLAALLFNLNTSAVSSISATINGSARLVERGSEEEKYYRDVHLANNTFDSATGPAEESSSTREDDERARLHDARVIVVGIKDVRIADWKGAVRDWVISSPDGGVSRGVPQVNGI